MKLIIDCGSTKADWVIINNSEVIKSFYTEGFNPNYTDINTISSIISGNLSYHNHLHDIREIYFYGSGCGNEKNCSLIEEILSSVFINAKVSVTNDMMAACHALFGNNEGIACILGTGSNSCRYNGVEITENMVSLGYVLGDEGGGSHLGKSLLHDYYYRILPDELSKKLENEFDMRLNVFLDNVYHNNQVSRYLASFSIFLYKNIEHEYVKSLCSRCFDVFIDNFISRYEHAKGYEIGFVGSIAFYFQDIIKQRLEIKGLRISKILKNPIEGLVVFHS